MRVPFYLVANKKLGDDVVGALTKAMMEARRELVSQYPLLAQIMAPSTDQDAYIPIHPGVAAYFDGDEKIFDKYGDQFFYGTILLGSLMSVLAAIWKFMTRKTEDLNKPPTTTRLFSLMDKINEVRSEAELAEIEQEIDGILKAEITKYSNGGIDAGEMGALSLASHRLEYLMGQRRAALNAATAVPIRA